MSDPIDLDQLLELHRNSSQRTWQSCRCGTFPCPGGMIVQWCESRTYRFHNDETFASAAHQAIPGLVARLYKAEAALETLRELGQDVVDCAYDEFDQAIDNLKVCLEGIVPAPPAKEAQVQEELNKLRDAIRHVRDQRGDNRCFRDWEAVYALLPEGYTPPENDVIVEMQNCAWFIASLHDERIAYVSSQDEIDRLRAEVSILRQEKDKLNQACQSLASRCFDQAQLLARHAERKPPPHDFVNHLARPNSDEPGQLLAISVGFKLSDNLFDKTRALLNLAINDGLVLLNQIRPHPVLIHESCLEPVVTFLHNYLHPAGLSCPYPGGSYTLEQACRDLLECAIEAKLVLRQPETDGRYLWSASSLAGMANLMNSYIKECQDAGAIRGDHQAAP